MITKHPGLRVKEELLPADMTITKAAQLLGISRSTLSKFLHGNAKLSPKMAQCLSKTFSFPLKKLKQWQAEYEKTLIQQSESPTTHIYSPNFLSIKANDIENWVAIDEILSRSRLAVLLRILAHSTNNKITRIDFPGNDDSQRPGWDGWIEAEGANPWIPEGISAWEFGVNKNIITKANNDFAKSINAHPSDSSNITFIFVTPRRWPAKSKWIREKKALHKWKDVRAYDSSDLEQWLAQSLPAQSWFANEAKLPTQEVDSLDSVWNKWANVCEPKLNASFFAKLIKLHKDEIATYLSQPPQKPFYIAADSKIEAIAFLSALLNSDDQFIFYRDNCLVFKAENVFPHLAQGSLSFIAITDNINVEKEIAQYSQQIHAFVVYPKNSNIGDIDLKLEILDPTTFIDALKKMNYSYNQAHSIAKKSGYSLTVLRRQLSKIIAINTPEWVDSKNQVLVPFLFAGVWDSSNKNDISILEKLSNKLAYDHLEKEFQVSLLLNDSPIWAVNTYRGIVSKIDLLFAIAPYITKADLEHFFMVAKLVLGEDDPVLDLPEEQQRLATIHDKKRLYSKNLRDSIGEMLILLAIHSESLFNHRLEFNCEIMVDKLIKELFSPLSLRTLLAQSSDLSIYAEASPKVFLEIIENDLTTDKFFLQLMQSVSDVRFSSPKYIDLLRALEKLAWNKSTVARVVKILAQLCQTEFHDNYANKPFESLSGIFRSWYPATNANTTERIFLIKKLSKDFPDIGWRICINQFTTSHSSPMEMPASRCIWRNDSEQQPITHQDIDDFCNTVVEITLTWPSYTFEKLLDLVKHIRNLTPEQQDKIWQLIKTWALNKATESEKMTMRGELWTRVFSRQARKDFPDMTFTKLSEQAYAALKPKETTDKYFWLFRSYWVDESANEMEDIPDMDSDERDEFIKQKRIEALKKIFREEGLQGILELCLEGDCADEIGFLSRYFVLPSDEYTVKLIKLALDYMKKAPHVNYKNIIRGMLGERNDNTSLLKALSQCLDDFDKVQVYLQSPFEASVWNLVNSLDINYQQEYWNHIMPSYYQNIKDATDGVRYLLAANRPQTAFAYIVPMLKKISPQVIFEILSAMLLPSAKDENNPPSYQFLKIAFSQIDKCQTLNLEQKAFLECLYITDITPYGNKSENCPIKSIELYLEKHPEFFVQLILEHYNKEAKNIIFERSLYILEALRRIPGKNDNGTINTEKLEEWIKQVLNFAHKNGLKNQVEHHIGKLLSHCQKGHDGIWPCEDIREVVENMHSKNMIEGMRIEKYNSRGGTERLPDKSNAQDCKLVEQYKNWSEQLAVSHPFVAEELLAELVKNYKDDAKYWDEKFRIQVHLS